jgi:hypothetical protein
MLAQAHFPHDQLQGVDAQAALKMLEEDKGVRWADEPAFFRFGERRASRCRVELLTLYWSRNGVGSGVALHANRWRLA